MADYHVKVNKDGAILAGTITKTGAWNHNSEVTEEALIAVRDHFIALSVKENKDVGYAWQYPNGKTLILKLEEQDTEKVEEGNG